MAKTEPEPPPLFYSNTNGAYYMQLENRRFLQIGDGSAKMHLRRAGLFGGGVSTGISDVEKALCTAQLERSVDYAGPLAGYRCGLHVTASGLRLLVTAEARSDVWEVPTAKGECPRLNRFMGELFGEQAPAVNAWLKFRLASLRKQDFRPGQLLVLAGPASCGKSLFQALVTEMLGGRAADPFMYMTGETTFNADLAQAEHWLMEEATGSTDIRTRKKFGDAIKAATVGGIFRIHGKGQKAFTAQTSRTMTLSINDETECLLVLPPFEASIADKITLIKCSKAKLSEDRAENWRLLTRELPSFVAWLHRWRMPERMADPRFGCKAYHNPELLEAVSEVAPESRLASLIDEVLDFKDGPWTGPAIELERELRQSKIGFAAERLLGHWGAACGAYLAKLALRFPDRYAVKSRSKGKTTWTIKPPEEP